MPLLLTTEEVEPLLEFSKAIELTEAAFKQQAEGQVVARAPIHIAVGGEKAPVGGRRALRIVSGALLGSRKVGVRLGPNYGQGGDHRGEAVISNIEAKFFSTVFALICFPIVGIPSGSVRLPWDFGLFAVLFGRPGR